MRDICCKDIVDWHGELNVDILTEGKRIICRNNVTEYWELDAFYAHSYSHSIAILLEESYLFSHKSTRSTGRKELLLYWMGYLSPQVISPKEKVV